MIRHSRKFRKLEFLYHRVGKFGVFLKGATTTKAQKSEKISEISSLFPFPLWKTKEKYVIISKCFVKSFLPKN